MPEADAAAAPVVPAKGKSKVMLLVLIAALLAACVAGAAVYFVTAKKEESAAEASGKAKHAEKKPALPAIYVKLDPPFVANFQARGNMRFLQVTVEVMTRDQETAGLIREHDPMIRNDLLMLLGSQTIDTIGTHEGKEQLRSEALEVVRKVVGGQGGTARKVEQLYFTSFVMQ